MKMVTRRAKRATSERLCCIVKRQAKMQNVWKWGRREEKRMKGEEFPVDQLTVSTSPSPFYTGYLQPSKTSASAPARH